MFWREVGRGSLQEDASGQASAFLNQMSSIGGALCDIAYAQSAREAAARIEAMDAWVLASALQQHVMAILRPGGGEG